jgi:hypothetical protein
VLDNDDTMRNKFISTRSLYLECSHQKIAYMGPGFNPITPLNYPFKFKTNIEMITPLIMIQTYISVFILQFKSGPCIKMLKGVY